MKSIEAYVLALLLFGLTMLGFSESAFAASVLDAGTTTAITAGFTDLKDTIIALLGVAWPFLIAVPVVMMSPKIVKGLIRAIASK